MIDALDSGISNWKSHPDASDGNIGVPFAMLNRCARPVDEFRYTNDPDDGTDTERLGSEFAEGYRLDVGIIASCVAGGDYASATFSSTDFSLLHTGRPSSAFETGLLGFSNEYYREFTEDSSTLRACLLYTSPSPRDRQKSRMPSSA